MCDIDPAEMIYAGEFGELLKTSCSWKELRETVFGVFVVDVVAVFVRFILILLYVT